MSRSWLHSCVGHMQLVAACTLPADASLPGANKNATAAPAPRPRPLPHCHTLTGGVPQPFPFLLSAPQCNTGSERLIQSPASLPQPPTPHSLCRVFAVVWPGEGRTARGQETDELVASPRSWTPRLAHRDSCLRSGGAGTSPPEFQVLSRREVGQRSVCPRSPQNLTPGVGNGAEEYGAPFSLLHSCFYSWPVWQGAGSLLSR